MNILSLRKLFLLSIFVAAAALLFCVGFTLSADCAYAENVQGKELGGINTQLSASNEGFSLQAGQLFDVIIDRSTDATLEDISDEIDDEAAEALEFELWKQSGGWLTYEEWLSIGELEAPYISGEFEAVEAAAQTETDSLYLVLRLDGKIMLAKNYPVNPRAREFQTRLNCKTLGELFAYMHRTEIGFEAALNYILPKAGSDIERVLQANEIEKIDAEMTFKPKTSPYFFFTNNRDGRQYSRFELAKQLEARLNGGTHFYGASSVAGATQEKNNVEISLSKKILKSVSVSSLKNDVAKISEFSTNYASSSANRKHNIALAASAICGTVLFPGDIFSFNAVVGPRTAERGYRDAKIIKDGEFVEGIGGGVCQVSTTVYNATVLAGMEIKYARQHSLPVSYVEPSRDAMVSSANDLKMANMSDKPIYIVTIATGDKLTVKCFSTPLEYQIKLRSAVTKRTPCEVERTLDTTLNAAEKVIKNGTDKIESEGYIEYYKNGNLVLSKRVRKDTYLPQKRIVLYNPDWVPPAVDAEMLQFEI